MAKILEMPKLSPTMEEGQISVWHKKKGDSVAVDDLLAEVETDKATMEYRSFDKGTLLEILAPAGTMVQLGQPVAILGEKGEDVSALVEKAGGAKAEGKPAEKEASKKEEAPKKEGAPKKKKAAPKEEEVEDAESEDEAEPEAEEAESEDGEAESEDEAAEPEDEAEPQDEEAESEEEEEEEEPQEKAAPKKAAAKDAPKKAAAPAKGAPKKEAAAEPAAPQKEAEEPAASGRVKASPYVRKLARERGLSLTGLAGSGPNGRIVARDLENVPAAAKAPAAPAAKAPAPKAAAAPATPGELAAPETRPLSMMRKAIARRLTESKREVPHFYLTIDVDADALHNLREQINADLAAGATAGDAPKVSFNDLLIKACAIALRRVPECNAQFTPEAILVHQRVDISVAVAVADGLVTPVVRDADGKSVLAISTEVRDLAGRAKAKKLKPEEMANGTFSISNLGMYGIDSFAAVINPPEGAILAVGQVRREPVVKGESVVPGRRLAMTLSCDHRVVDGAVGATFLKALRQIVEHPTQILLG